MNNRDISLTFVFLTESKFRVISYHIISYHYHIEWANRKKGGPNDEERERKRERNAIGSTPKKG